jgi:hypothetical protein
VKPIDWRDDLVGLGAPATKRANRTSHHGPPSMRFFNLPVTSSSAGSAHAPGMLQTWPCAQSLAV